MYIHMIIIYIYIEMYIFSMAFYVRNKPTSNTIFGREVVETVQTMKVVIRSTTIYIYIYCI